MLALAWAGLGRAGRPVELARCLDERNRATRRFTTSSLYQAISAGESFEIEVLYHQFRYRLAANLGPLCSFYRRSFTTLRESALTDFSRIIPLLSTKVENGGREREANHALINALLSIIVTGMPGHF